MFPFLQLSLPITFHSKLKFDIYFDFIIRVQGPPQKTATIYTFSTDKEVICTFLGIKLCLFNTNQGRIPFFPSL